MDDILYGIVIKVLDKVRESPNMLMSLSCFKYLIVTFPSPPQFPLTKALTMLLFGSQLRRALYTPSENKSLASPP